MHELYLLKKNLVGLEGNRQAIPINSIQQPC